MKPVLKAPGSVLLEPMYGGPLSNFAFDFHVCRYNTGKELCIVSDAVATGFKAGPYQRFTFVHRLS